jgi:hypothetical protein
LNARSLAGTSGMDVWLAGPARHTSRADPRPSKQA